MSLCVSVERMSVVVQLTRGFVARRDVTFDSFTN